MTPELMVMLAVGLGAPLLGIVAAFITNRVLKHNARESNDVSRQAVAVNEREAHTNEISMIIDGFTSSLEAMRKQLDDAKTELKASKEDYKKLRTDHELLATRVEESENQRAEMVNHILALEKLVPNPPGPPVRPTWS